jgi:hypothetical protein
MQPPIVFSWWMISVPSDPSSILSNSWRAEPKIFAEWRIVRDNSVNVSFFDPFTLHMRQPSETQKPARGGHQMTITKKSPGSFGEALAH